MDAGYFLSAVVYSIVKSVSYDPFACFAGDDLDTVSSVFVIHVFNALIQVFAVFSDHDEIDIIISAFYTVNTSDRSDIGIGIESLTQINIDAFETLAARSCGRAFNSQFDFPKFFQKSIFDQFS